MPRSYAKDSETYRGVIAARTKRWRAQSPDAPPDSVLESEARELWAKPEWTPTDWARWEWFCFYREDLTPESMPLALVRRAYGAEAAMAKSGQRRAMGKAQFRDFRAIDNHYRRLKATAEGWVEQWAANDTAKGLLFHGPVGSGKTYLLLCVFGAICQRGARPVWKDVQGWLGDMRGAIADDGNCESVFQAVANAPLLFLDDLGKGSMSDTNFALEQVTRLFDERHRRGALTLATTNLGFVNGEMERIVGERIFSRMHDMFQFVGPFPAHDWRREKEGRE